MFKSQIPNLKSQIRPGVTLIELLVVVAILSIVTAAAIPVMAPAVETRRLREASRGLSTFLAGARARAIDRDRPVGVEFLPFPSAPGAALEAFYVEVPPMYAGDTTGAKAMFTADGGPWTVSLSDAASATALVRKGDLIRFNYQGPWWTIEGPSDPTTGKITSTTISVRVPPNVNIPWKTTSPPAAFQIRRQPTRSSGTPFQMPGNAALDLVFSGTGTFDPAAPEFVSGVRIMFAPEGHIAGVYRGDNVQSALGGAIYLLIGGREKTEGLDLTSTTLWTEENCNLLDMKNQWIAISVQSGQAIAGEMTYIDPAVAATRTPAQVVAESRRLASDMRGQGGN